MFKDTKTYERIRSVNSLLKREISSVIFEDVKDHRLADVTSIMGVETSRDMQFSKVYVSVLGDREKKVNTIKGLNSASGFIRRRLRKNLQIRNVPTMKFFLDDSIDRDEEIQTLFDKLSEE